MNDLTRYWFVRWLRLNNIERLRNEHVARWSFNEGDVVCKVWCSACSAADHPGVLLKLVRGPGRTYARVRFACKAGEAEVGTLFLRRVLPPYSKEVLDLRRGTKKRKVQ